MTDLREFPIPLDCWSDFAKRLGKLNKRAKRLGTAPIIADVLRDELVERRHTFKIDGVEQTRAYKVKARIVVLNGPTPKLADWAFIAKVEYLGGGAMLFHAVPACEHKVDERFRALDEGTCEHCHKRRRRAETFIVRHTVTGEQKQVGRQCLSDFTGLGNSPEAVAAVLKWLHTYSNLDSEIGGFWGKAFENTIDTREALALTSAYISRYGWVPRSAQMPHATANLVMRHFDYRPSDSERAEMRAVREDLTLDPKHYDRADQTVTWVRGELAAKNATGRMSDYEANLVTLIAGDVATARHLGLVCSALPTYQRAMNQAVEYAKRHADNLKSEYVGALKERLRNVPVKIERVQIMEAGMWGPSTLVKMRDEKGNIFSWFASGDHEYHVGDKMLMTGTVKEHKEYREIKETRLSRVVLNEAPKIQEGVAA